MITPLHRLTTTSQFCLTQSPKQALGQCSQFLSTSLKEGLELIATSSTGEAARQLVVAQGEGTTVSNRLEACIASNICAESDVYKLRVLESDIQNSSSTYPQASLRYRCILTLSFLAILYTEQKTSLASCYLNLDPNLQTGCHTEETVLDI
jgi:hypothetical protein